VLVRGEPADVRGEEFTARVKLEEGANVVDVTASARGRAPTLTAIRIVRRVTVTVPDLEGESRDEAVERLDDLGLEAKVRRDEGFLDWLQPGGQSVCETDPAAGKDVRPGTTVEVVVSKDC
jgi:beta-lactam-binding protein with PASTA domain